MKENEPYEPERIWERGWEGHEIAQLKRLARLPLSQKLAWLEEAGRIVRHLAQARKAKRQAGGPRPSAPYSSDQGDTRASDSSAPQPP